ncbi:MAG: hypothetical protein M3Z49_10235, partial [Bifidobacteriales bacterium]|nr:hypothetical protein [Bifidobacteriales bacterium]
GMDDADGKLKEIHAAFEAINTPEAKNESTQRTDSSSAKSEPTQEDDAPIASSDSSLSKA